MVLSEGTTTIIVHYDCNALSITQMMDPFHIAVGGDMVRLCISDGCGALLRLVMLN